MMGIQAQKRERIIAELVANPNRSDRAIGKICDVNDKTVSLTRFRLGATSSYRVGVNGKIYNSFNKTYTKWPVPPALRWEVWERDDFRCQHCGARRFLEVDHIIPESRGGEMVVENLQTLCRPCNLKKGVT